MKKAILHFEPELEMISFHFDRINLSSRLTTTTSKKGGIAGGDPPPSLFMGYPLVEETYKGEGGT